LAKRRRKLDPNRFQKQDGQGLFSFDPIRRDCLKWGAIAGAGGGFFMLSQSLLAQIAGIFVIVFVSNYHISKASRLIPRWHATIISFIGVMAAMFGVIIVGTILISLYGVPGG
jgi:hypothetical protein